MSRKLCAIHQPNFFPWLGYFDKMARADVFVFLDHVDYPKSGSSMSSWCNRVKINEGGKAAWISCPVVREHGPQLIDTVRINSQRPWRDDMRKRLGTHYRHATNFAKAYALIDELLTYETDSLADFNVHVVRRLSRILGYDVELVRQSEMPAMTETATHRLIAICKHLGADAYLCGGGAGGYQEDDLFKAAGLDLVYQHFEPAPYGESGTFIPGLSVIDWLMHNRTWS